MYQPYELSTRLSSLQLLRRRTELGAVRLAVRGSALAWVEAVYDMVTGKSFKQSA